MGSTIVFTLARSPRSSACTICRVCDELHARADAVRAASPTRVDQPDVGVMLFDEPTEHLGVLARVPNEKHGTEAR